MLAAVKSAAADRRRPNALARILASTTTTPPSKREMKAARLEAAADRLAVIQRLNLADA